MNKEKITLIIAILSTTIIVLSLIYLFVFIPILQSSYNSGYNQAQIDYSNSKSIPVLYQENNQTKIQPVNVCSEVFQKGYSDYCNLT